MELSDSEEEIIDLNDEKSKAKEEEKKKTRVSSRNLKWVKQSIESISQIVKRKRN